MRNPLDLTDDERQALINMLTVEIEASKFPLSPRIEQLKRIGDKLRSETVPPEEPKHRRRSRERV
jgi:hypothetical protein